MTKSTKWPVHPAKTQISLGIHPVWSESSLCAQWVAQDPNFLHADSNDSDQPGRVPRLIRVFPGRTGHFVVLWLILMPATFYLMAVLRPRFSLFLESSTFTNGPRQANLVLIAYASSEGSGEPAHPRSLARTFAARSYKQWIERNLRTESQIPGPSKWLGMRSWNLSWQNARRHKFAWRGSNTHEICKHNKVTILSTSNTCIDQLRQTTDKPTN